MTRCQLVFNSCDSGIFEVKALSVLVRHIRLKSALTNSCPCDLIDPLRQDHLTAKQKGYQDMTLDNEMYVLSLFS